MSLADLDDAFETAAADRMSPDRFAALPAQWLANGFYTVTFPDGSHKTFRVRLEQHGVHRWSRTLAVLIGPDNSTDYECHGLVTDTGFRLWKRFAGGKPAEHAAILWMLARGELLDGYDLQLSKRCLRCNRPLTTPESLERGIGPECEQRTRK